MSRDLIESLSPVVAAGVAARAALSLHHTRDTTTAIEIENEAAIRAQLIQDARDHFNLGDSMEKSVLEKIAHAMYELSDHLLNRLEESIESFFTVQTDDHDNLMLKRRIRRENKVIAKTINYPTKVYQDYIGQKAATIIYQCIYVREVEGQYPFYEFVLARKSGKNVHVQAVLRMYPNVNRRITLPDGQLNLLLKAMGEKITIDALAEVLQAQFAESTIIIIYSCHWVFAYFDGGQTNPLRDLKIILGNGYLDGFAKVGSVTN
jgi:hypothetical protein